MIDAKKARKLSNDGDKVNLDTVYLLVFERIQYYAKMGRRTTNISSVIYYNSPIRDKIVAQLVKLGYTHIDHSDEIHLGERGWDEITW